MPKAWQEPHNTPVDGLSMEVRWAQIRLLVKLSGRFSGLPYKTPEEIKLK